MSIVTFQGSRNLRHRLILSTLSGTSIKIEKIRSNDLNPGLKDYEISLLRLLETLTNGCKIEISYTGTTLIYHPGIIIGGEFTHVCPLEKSIGYYIETILYLTPFAKRKSNILFKGLTSRKGDIGVDSIRWGLLPILEKFGVRECSLHTLKRGSVPDGGGEVQLIIDTLIAQPLTLHAIDDVKISAIKGVAYCTRVSPSIVNRMIDGARKILKNVGVEVNITADVMRGENSGKSPGFGICLVAESKKNNWRFFTQDDGDKGEIPEEIGERVALELLEEISLGKIVGKNQLALSIIFMIIGKEDIGRLKIGNLQIDENLIWLLRDIKKTFGLEVFLKPDEDDFILTIKGVGFTNTSKKIA